MRCPLLLLLLLLYSSPTIAKDDIQLAPGLTGTAAISFYVDDSGTVQILRTKPILIGSVETTPDVPEPDPITPTPSDPLAVKVSLLVAKAPTGPTETNTRSAVAALYKTVSQLPLTDPTQLHQATTILFDALKMSEGWKKWKADADSFSVALTLADTKRSWALIAEGLAK